MTSRLLLIAASVFAALPVACVTPAHVDVSTLPETFTALGTEPFWAAEVDGAVLIYRTPDDPAGQRVAISRRAKGARTEWIGTLDGSALSLVVGQGPCSDGMSDTVYPYSAEMRFGISDLHGCAKPR